MIKTYAPDDLLAAARDPDLADAARADGLAVRLAYAGRLGAPELALLGGWLGRQPIPVIGVGSAGDPLADAVDVLADGDDELGRLAAGIEANPAASAVLVQVLRSTVTMPIPGGLVLESLAYGMLQAGSEFRRWLDARGGRPPAPSRPSTPPAPVVRLQRDGDRLDVVLDSPANRNALSVAMRDALTEAFQLAAIDDSIRRVDVRGNGPCFSAGGDLTEFGTSDDPAAAHRIRMLRMPARFLAAAADRCHVHVHGACIGAGIELAAFARHVTAAPDAFFQLPEVAMGLIPGAGGCVSIPRRIGRQRTAWMALTNARVDAGQALAWGLVDAIES